MQRQSHPARPKVLAAQTAIVLALVWGWELAPNWMLEELLWSRPSAIFSQTVIWLSDGTLLRSAAATLRTVAAGMILGGLLGIASGLYAGASRAVARLVIGPIEPDLEVPKCSQPIRPIVASPHHMKDRVMIELRCPDAKLWHIYVPVRVIGTSAVAVAVHAIVQRDGNVDPGILGHRTERSGTLNETR